MNGLRRARSALRSVRWAGRAGTHAERLAEQYRAQAATYDAFRAHFLHGRAPLMELLPLEPGSRWVELGAGTGFNLELIGQDRLSHCERFHLVDLCGPLLEVARARVARRGWRNVEVHEADARVWEPPAPVDGVVLSYALTMMPRWFEVVDRAVSWLAGGGWLAATDLYVSGPWPEPGFVAHATWRRWLWPAALAVHDVYLSPDHLPYLHARSTRVVLREELGWMPMSLGLRAPYYVYLGRV